MKFDRDSLINFQPKHEFFVGIDSDGCVFDSMEPKQKECFCPVTIEKWGLAPISKYAREAWEFVNLYSQDRGCNRFFALQKAFDLLRQREAVKRRGVVIPELTALKEWTSRETKLGNPALKAEIERTNSDELKKIYDWSLAVNEAVARVVKGVKPFPLVKESLEKLRDKADIIVVSGTPLEALMREWQENDIDHYVAIIAGQEVGSKKEQLQFTTQGKYAAGRGLMVGDAPGDLKAAKANKLLFYPIIPGQEEQSWERFYHEIIDQFLEGKYTAEVEQHFIAEFNAHLPEKPSWI
ncbi:MAG: HAD hydrolase-like protein [candidate division KSB1 bacterium]|nr:HAD hydrolase-like protein [candidate division KSB1 bacterium]MDZ7358014.1 HAD hydrolase-like protein [candidate division KSB1 bacterium]MDZ7399415.1 HAD hydrolase-like protein [candidate division KSB1 bacterium]